MLEVEDVRVLGMDPTAVGLGAFEIMVGVWFWGAASHVVGAPFVTCFVFAAP